jgi:hypothetical protein
MHIKTHIKNVNASNNHTTNTQHSYEQFTQQNIIIKTKENYMLIDNQLVQRMNLPAIGTNVLFLSIEIKYQ